MIKQAKYDLVFMDHMMPEMDGIDATVAVRKLTGKYFQSLPIIALTANALVGTREMFIREGMNDFLAKPIDTKKLAYILQKWLPQSKISKVLPPSAIPSTSDIAPCNIAGVNVAKGISSVGGSFDNYLQILSSYYVDAQQKCAFLPSYLLEKSNSSFLNAVHSLKSTSATIGAADISAMAARLEAAVHDNDSSFIYSNIGGFIAHLQSLLKAIAPFLPEKATIRTSEASAIGNIEYLKNQLSRLTEAAELANIVALENILNGVKAFIWPQEIEQTITAISQCLSLFDYDGICEQVAHLEKMLK